MGASPGARRAVLLGLGLGLVLLGLEALTPPGWLSAGAALVSLVPVALAWALGGPAAGLLASAVGVGGAAWLLEGSAGLVVALKHALPGSVLGMVLARRLSLPVSLVMVAGASLVALALLLVVLVPGDASRLGVVARQFEARVSELEALSGRLALTGEAKALAQTVARTMRLAGPGVVLVGFLLGALANYLVARLCLRGDGFRPFATEAVPDHLVWWVIGGGLLAVSDQSALERAGLSLLVALVPLYAIQGLAVLRHLFLRLRAPRPLQVIGFGLFAVQPLLLVGAACVGLSDLWMDFRKIRQAPTPA